MGQYTGVGTHRRSCAEFVRGHAHFLEGQGKVLRVDATVAGNHALTTHVNVEATRCSKTSVNADRQRDRQKTFTPVLYNSSLLANCCDMHLAKST